MMEAIESKQTNNILRAEEFLKEISMDDDEEKQQEPELMLPIPKREYLSRKGDSFRDFHNSSFSSLGRSSGHRSLPISSTTGGGTIYSLRNFKNPFGGNDSSSSILQGSFNNNFESTPRGNGPLPRVSIGSDDIFLDEPSRRGTLRKKKGGINGPFYDHTGDTKDKREAILILMLAVSFFVASVGLALILVLQEHDPVVISMDVHNTTSLDSNMATLNGNVVGLESNITTSPAVGLIAALDEEEDAVAEEILTTEREENLVNSKEKEVLKEEEDVLVDLHEIIAEEEEVVDEVDGAINEEDKELLEREETNLSEQQDNLKWEASLIESELKAETPADAQFAKKKAKMTELGLYNLEHEQEQILEEESKVEGWDYNEAKAEATIEEKGGESENAAADEDGDGA